MASGNALSTDIPYGYHGFLTDPSTGQFYGLISCKTNIPTNNAPSSLNTNLRSPGYGVFLTGIQIVTISTSTATNTSSITNTSTSTGGNGNINYALLLSWSDNNSPSVVPYPGSISGQDMIAPSGQVITGVTVTPGIFPLTSTSISVRYGPLPTVISVSHTNGNRGFNGYMRSNSDGSFAGLAVDNQPVPLTQAPTTFIPFRTSTGPEIWLTGIKIDRPASNSCTDGSCDIKLIADDGYGNSQQIVYLPVSSQTASVQVNPSLVFQQLAPSGQLITAVHFLSSSNVTPSSTVVPDLMPQSVEYADAPSNPNSANSARLLVGVGVFLGILFLIFVIGGILFLTSATRLAFGRKRRRLVYVGSPYSGYPPPVYY